MQTATLELSRSVVRPERRRFGAKPGEAPRPLVLANLAGSRHQLADAREHLKADRRRVVQLEDVVASWEAIAAELSGQVQAH